MCVLDEQWFKNFSKSNEYREGLTNFSKKDSTNKIKRFKDFIGSDEYILAQMNYFKRKPEERLVWMADSNTKLARLKAETGQVRKKIELRIEELDNYLGLPKKKSKNIKNLVKIETQVELSFKRGVGAFCAMSGISISDFFVTAATEYIKKKADNYKDILDLVRQ
jgi:hypothetical protein